MVIRDYVENISEDSMREFLEEEMGAIVESVVKYYDESYGGHLFRVKMSGYENLPREDGGFLRFGKFGLVEDDLLDPIPTTYEAFETMLNNPNTLKKYVLFVNRFVKDNPQNMNSYISRFVDAYASFALSNKSGKTYEAAQDFVKRKRIIFNIQAEANRSSEELGDE